MKSEDVMKELNLHEIQSVSGGLGWGGWLVVLNCAADFCEGFRDGYKAK